MVFLFRDKSIINLFFLAILSIAVHVHFFTAAPLVLTNNSDGVFSLFLKNYVAPLPQPALFLLYHGLVLFQAIRLNMILNDFRMFQQYSYTAAMSYILLSGIFPQWCSISSALMANFLLIWLFNRMSRLYNHPSPKTLLFNTGLIIGLSVVCYHPTAIMILVVLFALVEVRPLNIAEWVVLLMGIIVPYYFIASWLFLEDNLSHIFSFLPTPGWSLPVQQWTPQLIIGLSALLLVLLPALYFWQGSNKRMIIQIRKNWGVMLSMLVILLPIPFIFSHAGIESALMTLVPIAAFSANVFSNPRRLLLPNILFWLCIAVIAYNNLLFIKN